MRSVTGRPRNFCWGKLGIGIKQAYCLYCGVVDLNNLLGGLLLEDDLSLAASYRVGLNPLNFNFVFSLCSSFLVLEEIYYLL